MFVTLPDFESQMSIKMTINPPIEALLMGVKDFNNSKLKVFQKVKILALKFI